eukprot:gnl/Dysnectes_brevis/1102_a1233_2051.p1 GENE.gnl/Dysnectes_brevis/1102_a1233_2051~~gnl/Dysnectes_brevis/1102_a1233_2051.p1  ORF type:complete len:453 (+),score=69.64 gnl/Dysnectes_brevis/1102_a1233_2051:591-1949(+)
MTEIPELDLSLSPPQGFPIGPSHSLYRLSRRINQSIPRILSWKHSDSPEIIDETNGTFKVSLPNPIDPNQPIKQTSPTKPKPSPKPLPGNWELKVYAPGMFSRFRTLMGITNDVLLEELAGSTPLGSTVSQGKSAALFFYSSSGRYIIKQLKPKEIQLQVSIMSNYNHHFMKFPHSLISKFVSIFRLKDGSKKHHFCVMDNMFSTPLHIEECYDLKGSSVGRTIGDKTFSGIDIPTKKDLDLQRGFRLTARRKELLMRQLRIDTAFLARHELIDYSLLVGIAKVPPGTRMVSHHSMVDSSEISDLCSMYGQPESLQSMFHSEMGGLWSRRARGSPAAGAAKGSAGSEGTLKSLSSTTDGSKTSHREGDILFLGVIDFLTEFTTRKSFERSFKAVVYDSRGISCQPPAFYRHRFLEAIDGHFGGCGDSSWMEGPNVEYEESSSEGYMSGDIFE